MKKHRMVVLALALAVVAGWTAGAFAADREASPPAKATKPAGESAGAEKRTAENQVKCEVTGKLEEKTATNARGREVKRFEVTVSQAKDAEGKALDALKGKVLRVAPKKGVDITAHLGKDVTITGTLVDNKKLVPESIK